MLCQYELQKTGKHTREAQEERERESERDCEERKIEKPENIEKKTIAQLSRHTE